MNRGKKLFRSGLGRPGGLLDCRAAKVYAHAGKRDSDMNCSSKRQGCTG
jgi:hypothetical protein